MSIRTSEPVWYGVTAEKFTPPFIRSGLKVLDIGAGDGRITAKLIEMVGKDNVWALEPNPKSYAQLVALLGANKRYKQKTLQEALKSDPQTFKEAFDVVTVFKYNVPYSERDNFIKALSESVKQEGTVFITSVEEEKFFKVPGLERVYLIPYLERYFHIKNRYIKKDEFGFPSYGLLELKRK